MDRKVLIIVENLPVPFDTRVWQEATTLAANGYTVSVISPTGKGYDKEYEFLHRRGRAAHCKVCSMCTNPRRPPPWGLRM